MKNKIMLGLVVGTVLLFAWFLAKPTPILGCMVIGSTCAAILFYFIVIMGPIYRPAIELTIAAVQTMAGGRVNLGRFRNLPLWVQVLAPSLLLVAVIAGGVFFWVGLSAPVGQFDRTQLIAILVMLASASGIMLIANKV